LPVRSMTRPTSVMSYFAVLCGLLPGHRVSSWLTFTAVASHHGGLRNVLVGVMRNRYGPRAQYVLLSVMVAHLVPLYST